MSHFLSFSAVGSKTDPCRVYSPYSHYPDLLGLAPARQILGAAILVSPPDVFERLQRPVCCIDWHNLQLLLTAFRYQPFPADAVRVVLLRVHALYFLVEGAPIAQNQLLQVVPLGNFCAPPGMRTVWRMNERGR